MLLSAAMIVASMTEGMGILLLIPILETLTTGDPETLVSIFLGKIALNFGLSLNLSTLVTLFVILVGFRSLVQIGRDHLGLSVQVLAVDRLRVLCMKSLIEANWKWVVNQKRADQKALLTIEINRIGAGLRSLVTLSATVAGLVAYLLVAFAISPPISALALATGLAIYLSLASVRKRASQLGHDLVIANQQLIASVEHGLNDLKLAKILGTEERHLDELNNSMAAVRLAQLSFNMSNATARALWQFLGATILGTYVVVGALWLQIETPVLVTLVLLFSRMLPGFVTVQQSVNQWLYTLPLIDEVQRFLKDSQTNSDHTSDREFPAPQFIDAVELKDVSIAFEGRGRPSLDSVSLKIVSQTTTVITGPSGAGKSTLADVLVGLLEPDRGVLCIDEKEMGPESRQAWMRSVAYIPQNVSLFYGTIRNNLLWGFSDANDTAVELALKRAAAEFVFDLPLGLETIVGDDGIRLSGGERQRIAIARALLRNVPLLILDEATSALDTQNGARVLEYLESIRGDLSIVVIGHGLLMPNLADQIIEMSDGKIVSTIVGNQKSG
jgi:ATP-binding cassette subfamily C protein